MPRLRISLANKCQLLFGGAVLLIVAAALAVPWWRMQTLVSDGQRAIARELADAWLADLIQLAGSLHTSPEPLVGADAEHPRRLRLITAEQFDALALGESTLAEAIESFFRDPTRQDLIRPIRDERGRRIYRYVRAVRQSDIERAGQPFSASLATAQVADPLEAVLIIDMRATWAAHQLMLNRVYIITAGLLATALAIAVFWFITTRLILSPVRVLRETAEKVSHGDLNIRADISTGDEFEQLSQAFNEMLRNTKISQDQLRDLNRQLDLKLGELAESNLLLYEADRLKGDFLANVSHELRTPLNSIIGFAEILAENAGRADYHDPDAVEKQRRYIDNILNSSRTLMQMITELLDLAKIEAGRIDLNIESMSVTDTCEVLLNLIRPQADRKNLQLSLDIARDLPIVTTDPGKFQQILFNFLSNAVKFTPDGGSVELGAAPQLDEDGQVVGVCAWVRDTGPGIPIEQQDSIFQKFSQLDVSHTRQHGGTGLGLAISKELTRLLDGRIELNSDVGRGATFTLIIPLQLTENKARALMPDLAG